MYTVAVLFFKIVYYRRRAADNRHACNAILYKWPPRVRAVVLPASRAASMCTAGSLEQQIEARGYK